MVSGAADAQAALARIYADTANYAGNWSIQYSDDGTTWSTATTGFVPNQQGWNSKGWTSVGVHRWWRLYLSNTPGPGSWLDELQLIGETNYIFFNGRRTARRDPSGAIHYYLADHLGSTSMVLSSTGAVENESEYYPWGGELKFSANDSGNHYKFTSKERDAETNLDYFGARYYGNALGRFLTPDWAAKPTTVPYAHFGDPQSLNLYAYVRNSPIINVDADGHNFAGWNGFMADKSGGFGPIDNTDELKMEAEMEAEAQRGQEQQTQQQSQTQQTQDNGGFWQKLGNLLTGNGWKTNMQVTAIHRQWLIDHKVEQVDSNGNRSSTDWSKASGQQVDAAYEYMQRVITAASINQQLSKQGFPPPVSFGHGARHLPKGLSQSEVEKAIQQQVQGIVKNATQPTTNFWGRVTVNGKIIEYRAFTLPNGTINVGTYYIPVP